MKTFFRSLKRQDGFTLVELMVVVAIIGLLSAVAIPNFRKYQAKAKVSEAKLQLSSVYTAETAFYSDYNIYHTCLAYMGFNPHREVANRYYAVGFMNAGAIDDSAYVVAQTAGLPATGDPLYATSCPDDNAANGLTANPPDPNATVPGNTSYFLAGKGVGSARANNVNFLPTTTLGTQASQLQMTFLAGAGGVIDGDNTANTQASQLTINHMKEFKVVRNGY